MSATALQRLAHFFDTHPSCRTRGFLPVEDPLPAFPAGSPLAMLDDMGAQLPDMLKDSGFREYVREKFWPGHWFEYCTGPEYLPELHLYYVRLAFMASAYVHQLGQPQVTVLPSNIAAPLVQVAKLLNRPPILSYDGYALYNWRRLDPKGPIIPDNLETIQNFMHLPDSDGVNQEQWFIVIHAAIEAVAARVLDVLAYIAGGDTDLAAALWYMAAAVHDMNAVQARIPKHMDPMVYYKTFRGYIQGFKSIVYEGVPGEPQTLRGEPGAQSSIFPLLDSFLKIRHDGRRKSTREFADMRNYMPAEHRELLELVDARPLDFTKRTRIVQQARNEALETMHAFNYRHLGN